MKKIVIFPYHPDCHILLSHKEFLLGYEIVGYISYNGDARLIRGLNDKLGAVEFTDDHYIDNCDALVLLDNYRNYSIDKYYKIIEYALSKNKDIYGTPLVMSQLNLVQYNGQFRVIEKLLDDMKSVDEEYANRTLQNNIILHKIPVPILAVIGQGKNCDKFMVQLMLKEAIEQDYKTVVVSSNALGALFNCYTMPHFMFANISFQEKIVKFNYFINNILKATNPDVLVIGIPEGIHPFESKEFHHFAEYPLVIANATPVDLAVLCTYFYQNPVEVGFRVMAELCEIKFDMTVGAIVISRTQVDTPDDDFKPISFDYLDDMYIDNYYPDLGHIDLPMIDISRLDTAKDMLLKTVELLGENVSTF